MSSDKDRQDGEPSWRRVARAIQQKAPIWWTKCQPKDAWALRLAWGLPAVFATYIFVRHAAIANRVLDGVRWFWLDDDQMISMRYARNLVEGNGLVWNPGEYVEGYTNFLWTLVMALVHLLGAPDDLSSLFVKIIAWILILASMWLTIDLVRSLGVRSRVVMCVAAFTVTVCTDVMYWAASGFGTSLSTFLHMFVVARLVRRGSLDRWGAVALALLPLVRGDSIVLWGGDALMVFILAEKRWRTIPVLALTLIPFVGHLAFRVVYYGEWFPNTYFLKVTGRTGRILSGWRYVEQFSRRYPFLLLMGGGATLALLRSGKRAAWLWPLCWLPICAYSMSAGGDNFRPYRFFSASMPILIGFAAAGVAAGLVSQNRIGRAMWMVLIVASVIPMNNTIEEIAQVGKNGRPPKHLVPAIWLRKNATPDASVAVVPAGVVPYYSRLRSLDVLGKNDKYIARLPQKAGAGIGHGKIDPAYTLGQKPDYVVSCRSRSFARGAAKTAKKKKKKELNKDYILTLLASDEFQNHYSRNSVGTKALDDQNAIFVHEDSPELARKDDWEAVQLDR